MSEQGLKRHRRRSVGTGPCLGTKSIDEILTLANNHHQNQTHPSPRGVADVDVSSADSDGGSNNEGSPPAKKNTAGSAVQCLEYAAGSKSPSSSTAASNANILGLFPNKQSAYFAINQCARLFLVDILDKTMVLAGYSNRMRFHPGDVSAALEYFVKLSDADGIWHRSIPSGAVVAEEDTTLIKRDTDSMEVDASDDEDWQEENDNSVFACDEYISEDEEMMEEAEDNSILAQQEQDEQNAEVDSVDSDHIPDETGTYMDLQGTHHPTFDTAYPPFANEEIQHLSNGQFREHVLMPIIHNDLKAGYEEEEGESSVEEMLKRAMYAFVVTKISSL